MNSPQRSRLASRHAAPLVVITGVICVAIVGVNAMAQKSPVPANKLPAALAAGAVEPAITVFVDVAGKRLEAADRLTATHAEMARRGYAFTQAVSHVENGDLQGFFVTYAPAG